MRLKKLAAALAFGSLCLLNPATPFHTGLRSVSAADAPLKPNEMEGSTKPSQHLEKMSFSYPGIVTKVYVKPGDKVKKGQLLMEQDIREEQRELERLAVEAESDVPIEYAQKTRDTKKVISERYAEMLKKQVTTDQEYLEKKLDYEAAELQIKKAKQDREMAQKSVEKQKEHIEKMKLFSTLDGVVERMELDEGEMAVPDPTKPACTLVTNKPLWVEVHPPIAVAQALKVGDKLPLRYRFQKAGRTMEATLIYRAPMADPGSDSQLVRLQMDNAEDNDSGLPVVVELPAQAVAAGQ